jgi:heme-degrading monooxygenase HmoA
MTIARHYVMVAAEGKAAELKAALAELATKVRPVPGCLGVELMSDMADAGRFVFIERWDSVESHKSGGKILGREAVAPVMACVGKPPEACSLDVEPLAL